MKYMYLRQDTVTIICLDTVNGVDVFSNKIIAFLKRLWMEKYSGGVHKSKSKEIS